MDWHYSMLGSNGGTYARLGAFCSGLQEFDAAYFMLPAPEALALDPNTRHLLHLSQVRLHCAKCYHALQGGLISYLDCRWPEGRQCMIISVQKYCTNERSL